MVHQLIQVNLQKMNSITIVKAKQFDELRILDVELIDGTTPFEIPEGYDVNIKARKPDGCPILNPCTFDGNVVHVVCTRQMMAAAGKLHCEIQIINHEGEVKSATFVMDIQPSVWHDCHIISTPEYLSMQQILELMREIETHVEEMEKHVEDIETELKDDVIAATNNANDAADYARNTADEAAGNANRAADNANEAADRANEAADRTFTTQPIFLYGDYDMPVSSSDVPISTLGGIEDEDGLDVFVNNLYAVIGTDYTVDYSANKLVFHAALAQGTNVHYKITKYVLAGDDTGTIATNLMMHVDNKSNPHSVTASQIGAFPESKIIYSSSQPAYVEGAIWLKPV